MSRPGPILRIHPPIVGGQEQVCVLTGQPITLGRGEDCDVVLLEQAASRHHARVEPAGGGWMLVDLGSKGGVWLGDQAVQRHTLQDGDVFRIGGTEIRFVRHPHAQPTILPAGAGVAEAAVAPTIVATDPTPAPHVARPAPAAWRRPEPAAPPAAAPPAAPPWPPPATPAAPAAWPAAAPPPGPGPAAPPPPPVPPVAPRAAVPAAPPPRAAAFAPPPDPTFYDDGLVAHAGNRAGSVYHLGIGPELAGTGRTFMWDRAAQLPNPGASESFMSSIGDIVHEPEPRRSSRVRVWLVLVVLAAALVGGLVYALELARA